MYPFKNDNVLLRDFWYVGALSEEVENKPLGRMIVGEPVVFYRKKDGGVVATSGLCPHRFFPLAEGSVDGDNLVCAYHGINFGPDGRCVRIPSQDFVPSNARIRTYPIIERGGLVWIWTGIAGEADMAAFPDLDETGITAPGFKTDCYTWRFANGRYMALCENLTDLSHIGVLHSKSAPGALDHWLNSPMTISGSDGVYRIVRSMTGPWNSFLEAQYGPELAIEGEIEMHTQSDYYSHAYMRTSSFIIDKIANATSVPADYGLSFQHHLITPATATSTHYFGCRSRNFRLVDPDYDAIWKEADYRVRQEDVYAIEAMEPYLAEFADPRRELIAKADSVSVRFRRNMQRKLDAEAERYQRQATVHQLPGTSDAVA